MIFVFDVEKKIPQISAGLSHRAEARSEVYYSVEEKASMEQAGQDRKAEGEPHQGTEGSLCQEGPGFQRRGAKYQAKLAEKKAKEEARAAKRKKSCRIKEKKSMEKAKRKMRKGVKIALVIATVLVIAAVVPPAVMFCSQAFHKGNDDQYSAANAQPLNGSPLQGKTIIFLGSSVTYGSAAKGESFVDYMVKQDGIVAIKEAVSGTTLVDETVGDKKSYIERMKTIDPTIQADAFICQLSTNDATMKKPLGEVSDSFELEDFDTQTVAGAIEYVIAYTKQTWDCPVIFYTGTQYKSEHYEKMVTLLLQIQKKWDIGVINLWNDEEMNAVSKADYNLYMVDGIHPSRAGYRDWWTPKFEAFISEYLASPAFTTGQ